MDGFVLTAGPAAELAENVSQPFERARAMPKCVYSSEEFLQLELEHIFRKDWFCVGREDGLARPGDYLAFDLAGQPIMVLRDNDGKIRAQANVCRHRMSKIVEGRGNTRTLVCPYHGWTYGLDGRLRGAPGMARNSDFDKSRYRLPQIRCEIWLGWVLVTLNPDAPQVAEHLAEVEAMIEDYAMQDYSQGFFEVMEWDTNWKILAENFMESYHLPVCHAKTIGGLSLVDDVECPKGRPAFNYHTLQKDPEFTLSVAHPENVRLKGDRRFMTWLLAIYPSMLITLTPGYFWYLSLHPVSPGKVRIFFGGGMSKEFKSDPNGAKHFAELRKLLDEVNEEDRGCTERVYAGSLSEFAEPGHLSHLERPNFEFANYLSKRIPAQVPEIDKATVG